jgi:hypothetical protein
MHDPHSPATGTPGGSDRTRTLPLPEGYGAVSDSRRFTSQALTEFSWLPPADPVARTAAEDVVLLVSELVTNACRHGAAPYRLTLRTHDGPATHLALRIEVSDADPTPPVLCGQHRLDLPGGHGMRLVGLLARDWGVQQHRDGSGKTVWLEITRGRSGSAGTP